jgi:hypothetical protein
MAWNAKWKLTCHPQIEEEGEPIKIHNSYQNIILPKKVFLQIKVGTLYLVKF